LNIKINVIAGKLLTCRLQAPHILFAVSPPVRRVINLVLKVENIKNLFPVAAAATTKAAGT